MRESLKTLAIILSVTAAGSAIQYFDQKRALDAAKQRIADGEIVNAELHARSLRDRASMKAREDQIDARLTRLESALNRFHPTAAPPSH